MAEPVFATAMLCIMCAILRVSVPIIADGLLTAVVRVLFPRKGF